MRITTWMILTLTLALCPAVQAGSSGAGAGSSKASFSKGAPACASASDTVPTPTGPGRLARVTAYWPGEDYYTNRRMSATGARLRVGYCAVDANIIPYGSVVHIPGIGSFLAMDTGTAVISRKAARESGHSREERAAMVIDLFFPSRRAGELFSREGPKFALVMWDAAAGVLADK